MRPKFLPLILAGSVLAAFVLCAAVLMNLVPAFAALLSLVGIGMAFLVKDAQLKKTRALPASASATVDGAGIDLGHGGFGDFLADAELKISAPAVTTTMAPDTRTFTYSVIHSDSANLGTPAIIHNSVIVQAGAGGAGAAAAEAIVRLPVDVKRYVGLRIVSGASTTDASAVAATLELLT